MLVFCVDYLISIKQFDHLNSFAESVEPSVIGSFIQICGTSAMHTKETVIRLSFATYNFHNNSRQEIFQEQNTYPALVRVSGLLLFLQSSASRTKNKPLYPFIHNKVQGNASRGATTSTKQLATSISGEFNQINVILGEIYFL